MPIIILNGSAFTGTFNSSFPRSFVGPILASKLGCLDAISVTTQPFQDSLFVCVLTFEILDDLSKTCILGVDYFCRILHDTDIGMQFFLVKLFTSC